jgi:phosphatidate cytidylyltransferase
VIAATVGLGVATNFAQAEGLVVALLVGCAGVVAWRIGDERIENTLADSLAGVLTLLWIPFLGSFLFLLELADDGWQRVIIVVLAVVGNDTGGLVSGVMFGKHKLLPRVSPAKTWEGAVGGLLLGTLAATVAAYFFFDGEWYIGTAVGAACAMAAVMGDLAESALKRDIQVKDMSTALPGHGGILDRIDSLLFATPVGYVVFAIFLGTLGGGGL